MRPAAAAAFLLGLAVLASVEGGAAQEFQVHLERPRRVTFTSKAPFEEFEGVTDRIDGYAFLEGEGLGGETDLARSEFHFEVDLASLDTGIGLRDRQMRENYLETDRFPYATFSGRITALQAAESADGRGWDVRARGVLGIHGVEREREVSCRMEPVGEAYRVRCSFPVRLPDHDIRIPRLMFLKINETVRVDVDFHLVPVTEGGSP